MSAYQERRKRKRCTVIGVCFDALALEKAAEEIAVQAVTYEPKKRLSGAVVLLLDNEGCLSIGSATLALGHRRINGILDALVAHIAQVQSEWPPC